MDVDVIGGLDAVCITKHIGVAGYEALMSGLFVRHLFDAALSVSVRWSSKGAQRQDVLNEGDSIYIDSWVPHSFYSLTPDSQILAIDYSS
ncbi:MULTISPECIES: hypothetical protein [Pseudomonas]|uniref:Uncharacterized protein n=1 Tax=Pseudomonas quercus TaxID=2722792 RepID=A0ABX0YCM2_9PSED|nr:MULTISPECIES: hypothetical protein [Pseudomonas]MBF7142532.1 hypothetical protein [Pseudomonas sp. LY10J]NJP01070.1 hypothetical protein [Pseudomonas quercus]